MKEIVVISGKGGTGKTSIVAAFAALARNAVIADCDVDAADLHLILSPRIQQRHIFTSGREAVIRQEDCRQCGSCHDLCRFGAVKKTERPEGDAVTEAYRIDPTACEGCGVCVHFCEAGAIDFPERVCGEWFVSDTRCGPMVHARLGVAGENSGKLVTTVRKEARRIAEEEGKDTVLVDGSPGIGCPVIASVTGASLVLVVTEPTLSGEHDLDRVLDLGKHFRVPMAVCINKWDLNPEMADRIGKKAAAAGAPVVGRIRYDRAVTRAQVQGGSVLADKTSKAAADIRSMVRAHLSIITGSPVVAEVS